MAFTREQVRDSIERAGDAHWQALIRHHTEAYPESRPTPGDVARAEAERLNDLGLGNNPNSSWWRAGSSRFPPQYASPTFSRIAPKAPDSKPSRSLATTEPLGDLDLVEGRGGALPDGALARRTTTPTLTAIVGGGTGTPRVTSAPLTNVNRCPPVRRPQVSLNAGLRRLLLLPRGAAVQRRGAAPGSRAGPRCCSCGTQGAVQNRQGQTAHRRARR
jgi:hypothetical protein